MKSKQPRVLQCPRHRHLEKKPVVVFCPRSNVNILHQRTIISDAAIKDWDESLAYMA